MPTVIPSSTYRLHLTHEFTLDDARALVAHVDRLGIDWMYASPVQQVPAGAAHGYHVLDPGVIDPQLGGRDALEALSAALADRGRGLILDIVPNHLAASPANARWADVLRHGPDATHAATFDLDQGTPEDRRPIVLPVLAAPVEEVLADGDIRIDRAGDEPVLVVHDELRLPLAPGTDPEAPLADVLDAQHYRLMEWQEGERQLNWRRFFAVNELVAVRVEDPDVFDDTHHLILDLVDRGVVQGLRVDHIDGLADPAGYLQQLRDAVGPDVYLLVEKILETGEALPDWPVEGTTGYEVATMIGAWLTDMRGYHQLRDDFESRTGITGPVAHALADSKHHVLTELFAAEVEAVRRLLGDIDGIDAESVVGVLRDMAAHMSGYRTYAPPSGPIGAADRRVLADAEAAAAVTHGRRVAHAVVEVLLSDSHRPALLRWQQLTGPAAAKGFEDRLLFRHVALASLCEVGADAHLLDDPPEVADIVAALLQRQQDWPHAGTTSTTHDTKLSEDVRARIAVLAEVPDAFEHLLDDLASTIEVPIDEHARWLLTQIAVGALDLESPDPADLTPRLIAYASKALREAELHTSHRAPDADHEAGVARWVDALTTPGHASDALRRLGDQIAVPGASNALSALTLKLVGPGVPDIYRGTETWDSSLVDPDNRRPLRVEHLRTLLDRLEAEIGAPLPSQDRSADVAAARDRWQDGLVKLLVTRAGLHLRRDRPDLFTTGALDVPPVGGLQAAHAAVLRRRTPGSPAHTAVAVATRLPVALAGTAWPIGEVWKDTAVEVGGAGALLDVITGRVHTPDDGVLQMGQVLSTLPVAILVSDA